MIILTRLGVGLPLAVNPDLIERAERTPDTVITLVDGSKLVVVETLDEVMARVRAWRAAVVAEAYLMALQTTSEQATSGESPQPADQPSGRPRLHLAAVPAESDPESEGGQPPGAADAGGHPNALPAGHLDDLAMQSALSSLARALRLPRKG